jgi:hypothetical protein
MSDNKIAISPDGRFLAFHRTQPVFVPAMMMPKNGAPPEANARPDDVPVNFVLQQKQPETKPKVVDELPMLEPPLQSIDPGPNGERQMWVTLLELTTGKVVWNTNLTETGHGEMTFSADGKLLALGYVNGKNGFVQVWDTTSDGQPFKHQSVAKYSGHHGAVNAVAFSPDSKKLASGGDDRRVKLWKLPAVGEPGPGANGPGFGVPGVMPAPAQKIIDDK